MSVGSWRIPEDRQPCTEQCIAFFTNFPQKSALHRETLAFAHLFISHPCSSFPERSNNSYEGRTTETVSLLAPFAI